MKKALIIIVIVVVLLLGYFFILGSSEDTSLSNGITDLNSGNVDLDGAVETNKEPNEDSSMTEYQGEGFSVKYPKDMFILEENVEGSIRQIGTSNSTRFPENKYYDATGFSLKRSVDAEICSGTGACSDATNPTIGFQVAEVNPYEIIDSYKEFYSSYGDPLQDLDVDGRPAIYVESGSHGTGQFAYRIAMSDTKVLTAYGSYIHETALPHFEDVEGFITFDEQKALFEQIVSTISFE